MRIKRYLNINDNESVSGHKGLLLLTKKQVDGYKTFLLIVPDEEVYLAHIHR